MSSATGAMLRKALEQLHHSWFSVSGGRLSDRVRTLKAHAKGAEPVRLARCLHIHGGVLDQTKGLHQIYDARPVLCAAGIGICSGEYHHHDGQVMCRSQLLLE
eukprot:6195318-Pleurochrysis_carterae.AAC.4